MDVQTIATEVQTTEVEMESVSSPPIANSQQPTADLSRVRDLVLKAHPDVVPDLIAGGSIDELIASVEPARSAYQRVADQVRGTTSREAEKASGREEPHDASTPLAMQPPTVPAGGASNVTDPGDLGPTTKIAQALAARKRQ